MPRHLRFAGLQQRTLRAYRLSIDRFLVFSKIHRLPLRTSPQLDYAVAEFINALYQEGDSLAQAGHLLSGLKRFYPSMRLELPTASQYFRNWQRIHRPERAVPISWDLLQAMAALCLELGSPHVALMLYVGFFCFLRTSEMLSLQLLHLIPDSRSHRITVIIPFAKTSVGNPQVVVFHDSRIHRLAITVLKARAQQSFLWPSSPGRFRFFWHRLLEAFEFAPDDYSPYSIRRGGATWHTLRTASMDATLQLGRWTCNRTARMYIDQGKFAMAKFFWTSRQSRRVRQWALKGAKYFRRLRQKNKAAENGSFVCFGCFVFSFFFGSPCFSWFVTLVTPALKFGNGRFLEPTLLECLFRPTLLRLMTQPLTTKNCVSG
jgi:integrase